MGEGSRCVWSQCWEASVFLLAEHARDHLGGASRFKPSTADKPHDDGWPCPDFTPTSVGGVEFPHFNLAYDTISTRWANYHDDLPAQHNLAWSPAGVRGMEGEIRAKSPAGLDYREN